MDTVQKTMSGLSLDLGPLKEPLGFIRVLEWAHKMYGNISYVGVSYFGVSCTSFPVFTIFAFATTGGYTGTSHFTVSCKEGTKDQNVDVHFGYPFRLPAQPYYVPNCNHSQTNTRYLQGDFSSSAEFFVCIGVFGFLYCTAMLILYLGYQNVYRQNTRGPIIDLVLTALFAFLWLVSSSAWGKGLTDIKRATSPERLVDSCNNCKAGEFPLMGRLNASVIFGFLNLILWAGNCWFIFKETPFHKEPNQPPTVEEGGTPGP